MDLPSNSEARKNPVPAKVEKVVTGTVVKRRKSTSRIFVDSFMAEDPRSIIDKVTEDVVVPGVKTFLETVLRETIATAFWGPSRSRSANIIQGTKHRGRTSIISYNDVQPSGIRAIEDRQVPPPRRSIDIGNYVLGTRLEAESVLDTLYGLLNKYDVVTVASFYEALGEPVNTTDYSFGWTSFHGVDIRRVSNGFYIDLPKPVHLK